MKRESWTIARIAAHGGAAHGGEGPVSQSVVGQLTYRR
jgi:hypothetical protein